ncbi:M56 family metallopeptidase [Elizabethkingia anophelis]|uniref:M56 family metallopeptidase n=1 Tax=Elizabethkingia anophelis TaxID=1117645 RepID=UPI0008406925|nr:M56 family metallopeptidase [Elizabethkingia anophelis]MCT3662363.1 peptidase m56 blar1 [Elizabethkingia anophelis]MCT3801998.1 peptidase m56 blar1 [Elizabethkingia anophelis]MCT4058693.1 peptidase m56 blar1 [Elizabethkingia anophelis]MCT4069302.1 peptidase m56 blar1 [Elizabethkingia anophelis]MCT4117893.1 peptidase m56 blar1 [Elizabethkingia anophelis]
METLLYFGKMLICSAIMWGYYLLFLKDKTFHHYNRFYLLATIVISLLLPLLKVEYFTIETDNRLFLLLQNFSIQTVSQKTDGIDWKNIALFALLAVSLVLFVRLLIGIYKIYQMKNQYQGKELKGVRFYITDLHDAPFSFFKNLFWKKSIEIDSDLGKQILKHEMVHIEQKHSWDKIFIEFVQAAFWFNPIFYWIKKELFLIHEYLADKKAVKQNDTKAFAQMLLASKFSGTHLPATSPFLSSNLKKRLQMLTKPHYTKFSYARRVMALPVLFGISFTYLVTAKNKEIANTNREIAVAIKALQQDTIGSENNKNVHIQIKENNNRGSLLSKIEKASGNAIFKINGKAVTKSEFTEFYHQNKNARYAYNHSGNSASGTTIFDAYDLSSKDLSGDTKSKFAENSKRFKNNQRSIIYNGNYVRYEDMTADQKKDFDSAMKEAQKAKDYINSAEYKKIIADAKKAGEEGRKAAEKARAYLNSDEYKKIMEDSRKAAEKARAYLNSAEYKQIIENSRREVEKSRNYLNSPEYKQIMENAKKAAEEGRKQAEKAREFLNSPEYKKMMEEGRLATQNLNNKVRDSFKNIDFSGTFMTKEKQNKVLEELKNSLKDKNMKDEDIQKILENVKKNFSNSSKFGTAINLSSKTDSPFVMAVAGNEPRSYSFTSTYSTTGDDVGKPSLKITSFGKDAEVYLNGVKVEYDDIKDINPKEIQSMSVSKSTGKKTIIKIQKKS